MGSWRHKKPYKCDVCGKEFTQPGIYNKHKREQHNVVLRSFIEINNDQCSEIEETILPTSNGTSEKQSSENAETLHFNSEVYLYSKFDDDIASQTSKCKICGHVFRGKYRKHFMKYHIWGHEGVKPHKCGLCGKSFTMTGTLNKHKSKQHTHRWITPIEFKKSTGIDPYLDKRQHF